MARALTTFEKSWIGALALAWALFMGLSLHHHLVWGLQAGSVIAVWLPEGEEGYPEVAANSLEFDPPGSGPKPGDRLHSIGDVDARGFDNLEINFALGQESLKASGDLIGPVHMEFGREGQVLHTVGRKRSVPAGWLLPLGAILVGGCGLLVRIRAPDSPMARRGLPVFINISGITAMFPAQTVAIALSSLWLHAGMLLVGWPLLVCWAVSIPDESAPTSRWPYLLAWLLAPLSLVSGYWIWLTSSPVLASIGAWVGFDTGPVGLVVVLVLSILVRNYRRATPRGRRQVRWIVYAVGLWLLVTVGTFVGSFLNPDQGQTWVNLGQICTVLLPLAMLIAILRSDLLDIDRLISGTTAYAGCLIALMVIVLAGLPWLADSMAGMLGVDVAQVQLILAASVALVALPARRVVQPWVDRLFFPERIALQQGIAGFQLDSAVGGVREVLRACGEHLIRLVHPVGCRAYVYGPDGYEVAYASGPGLEGSTLSLDDPAVAVLKSEAGPLARTRWGFRSPLTEFERAALTRLEADLVLPVRSDGELVAFVCLGPKSSGDIYTPTDLALLGSLAGRVGASPLQRGPGAGDHRLASILSADVVGYSRLMAEDEHATVRALKARRRIVGEHAAAHHGRVVDSPGDNVLAEFSSAVDAVRCAIAVQRNVAALNESEPDDRRMQLRIGIHLGDVLVDGNRIYGSGINVAARLESLAESGGICLSAAVYEQVRNKLDITFRDMGDQSVKNIPDPVRAYAITPHTNNPDAS